MNGPGSCFLLVEREESAQTKQMIGAADKSVCAGLLQRQLAQIFAGFVRRKVCRFCADSTIELDYKDPKALRLFVTETGKMIPRRISGNCARHQRPLAIAIKRARHLALLPQAGQEL